MTEKVPGVGAPETTKSMTDNDVDDDILYDSFDDLVSKYSPLIGLYGESYEPLIKMVMYSVIADQIKHNKMVFNSKSIDLRIPLMIMLKAGYGKKEIEYFIKTSILGSGHSYCEPTSYHPEQFVGRVNHHQEKDENNKIKMVYEQIPGFLSNDYLIIDEAFKLLTSTEDNDLECLSYTRTALDPIGRNTITKKQVGIPEHEKLVYDPDCTVTMLSQPINEIDESLLTKGNLRRFTLLPMNIPESEHSEGRRISKFGSHAENLSAQWQEWLKLLSDIQKVSDMQNLSTCLKYTIEDGCDGLVDTYIDMLLSKLKISKEVYEFVDSSQYAIKHNIFKMSIIRALVKDIKNEVYISKDDIQAAINDYNIVVDLVHTWVGGHMILASDLPMGWNQKHAEIFNIIKENPNINIKNLQDTYGKNHIDVKGTSIPKTIQRLVDKLLQWNKITKIKEGNIVYLKITQKDTCGDVKDKSETRNKTDVETYKT